MVTVINFTWCVFYNNNFPQKLYTEENQGKNNQREKSRHLEDNIQAKIVAVRVANYIVNVSWNTSEKMKICKVSLKKKKWKTIYSVQKYLPLLIVRSFHSRFKNTSVHICLTPQRPGTSVLDYREGSIPS